MTIPFIPTILYCSFLIDVAYKGQTVKQWLMDLARAWIAEMEKKEILPKGSPKRSKRLTI